MYIFAIHLKHFRSFKDLWIFPREDVNVLVGPNNCGKTTLLHALVLMLDPEINVRRPDVISRFDFYAVDLDHEIELRVWLKSKGDQGDKSYTQQLKGSDESQNDAIRVQESEEIKLAFFDKLTEWEIEIEESEDRGYQERHPTSLKPFTIEPMDDPADVPPHEKLLALRLVGKWNAPQETADIEASIVDQMGNELSPFGTKSRELLGFRFIGARRNPLYELSLSRRSILSRMLNEDEIILALRALLRDLDSSSSHLIDKPSVQSLLSTLGRLVAPEVLGGLMNNLGAQFTLTFLNGELWRLRGATSIATRVGTSPDGTPTNLPLEFQGDGAQNIILLFHLIELLKSRQSNNIIALEEPEQNLEPALARWIFGELCALADRSHNESNQTSTSCGQIFISTHSPALVNELRGTDALIVFSLADSARSPGPQWRAITAKNLSPDRRKKLDQRREQYIGTLFARQVLIVEGPSELGLLPVAFRHLAKGDVKGNPYHLGLEVISVDGKDKMKAWNYEHLRVLKGFGRTCHMLLDYDGHQPEWEAEITNRFNGLADYVTSWPQRNVLDFANGCDLETILAAYVEPSVLFEAIKYAYSDAGHPLQREKWEDACKKEIQDQQIVDELPQIYDGGEHLDDVQLESLGDERIQRAFLLILLHGPHGCKAVKDMRMIAEVIARHNAFPSVIDALRQRVLKSMIAAEEVDHAHPYLAP